MEISPSVTEIDYTGRLARKEVFFNPKNFDTPLPPDRQVEYANWKAAYAPNDSGQDYDLQGAFLAGYTPDTQTGHWDDRFKKPNHPTFSNQSQYATGKWAKYAGSWIGKGPDAVYVPAKVWNEK